jgi:exopolyphosphatase/guanosine-5'-triphosphate,3'-diphosphate pyrophosphatase
VEDGIAVAGTATTLAAIAQELDPYDPDKVHGYRVGRATCERIVAQLAALTVADRRRVTGLHPDRAPSIVAGAAILLQSMRAFELDEVEVSEADILHGAALTATGAARKD